MTPLFFVGAALGNALSAPLNAPVDLMALLEGFERRVLELRLGFVGDPLSYAEVSRVLGVTSNRVRRAERRALDRLREVCPHGERERLAG